MSAPAQGLPARTLQRLKHETAALHAQVEALVDIMRPEVSRADYLHFLVTLRGFHVPLERQLRHVVGLVTYLPDVARRRKAPLLERDLCALGVATAQLAAWPPCPELPALTSVSRALGALYVLEGSTLGGQLMYRHLRVRLPAEVAAARAFLTCYGPETGAMWRSFGVRLEAAVAALHGEAEVLAAARDTFACLGAWLAQCRARRSAPRDTETGGTP
jgi:heme oxygenase